MFVGKGSLGTACFVQLAGFLSAKMGGTPDKEAVREEAPESAEEPGNARALPDDSQRRRGLSEDGEAKATSDEAPSASQLQASAAAVASSAQSGDAEGEAGSDDASLTLQVVTLDAERFSVRASRSEGTPGKQRLSLALPASSVWNLFKGKAFLGLPGVCVRGRLECVRAESLAR